MTYARKNNDKEGKKNLKNVTKRNLKMKIIIIILLIIVIVNNSSSNDYHDGKRKGKALKVHLKRL